MGVPDAASSLTAGAGVFELIIQEQLRVVDDLPLGRQGLARLGQQLRTLGNADRRRLRRRMFDEAGTVLGIGALGNVRVGIRAGHVALSPAAVASVEVSEVLVPGPNGDVRCLVNRPVGGCGRS